MRENKDIAFIIRDLPSEIISIAYNPNSSQQKKKIRFNFIILKLSSLKDYMVNIKLFYRQSIYRVVIKHRFLMVVVLLFSR